jgi:hypothetical protein
MTADMIAQIYAYTAVGVGVILAAAGLGSEHVHLRRSDGVLPVHHSGVRDVVPVRQSVRWRTELGARRTLIQGCLPG